MREAKGERGGTDGERAVDTKIAFIFAMVEMEELGGNC